MVQNSGYLVSRHIRLLPVWKRSGSSCKTDPWANKETTRQADSRCSHISRTKPTKYRCKDCSVHDIAVPPRKPYQPTTYSNAMQNPVHTFMLHKKKARRRHKHTRWCPLICMSIYTVYKLLDILMDWEIMGKLRLLSEPSAAFRRYAYGQFYVTQGQSFCSYPPLIFYLIYTIECEKVCLNSRAFPFFSSGYPEFLIEELPKSPWKLPHYRRAYLTTSK